MVSVTRATAPRRCRRAEGQQDGDKRRLTTGPPFAQFEQRRGKRPPVRELRAEIDVAREREQRVGTHACARRLADELDEAILKRRLPIGQRSGISARAHALLRDVRDTVADIESRVAFAVEIEVDEIEPLTVEQRVVG
jgi:hypothetical protein